MTDDGARGYESGLTFDRVQKGSLYARAGIVDYWIGLSRSVGIRALISRRLGSRYASVERFRPPVALTLLGVPAAAIPVAALLP